MPCSASSGRHPPSALAAPAGYAMEEQVAEIGADLGITPETRDDHAAYIASWLKVLKDDKRAIFTAASHAQKAADYLHGLQPREAQS
jgi:antirestriction protein ArdC